MFVIFLSALAIVLARYTGKPAVAIWSHLANRLQPNTLDVVGWFANTHILGIDLASNPTGEELLRQVHAVVAGAYSNQELPLPLLRRSVGPTPQVADATLLIDFTPARRPQLSGIRRNALEMEDSPLPESTTPRRPRARGYRHGVPEAAGPLYCKRLNGERGLL